MARDPAPHDLAAQHLACDRRWFSFQVGSIELWLFRPPETDENRAIREEGERLRRNFADQYRHERSARATAGISARRSNPGPPMIAELDVWRREHAHPELR
jgi:hypothetical protein